MRNKLHIKKGDNVIVISGNSKGDKGKVLFVDVEKQRAIVEGVNMVSKHSKPNAENPKGGIVQKEGYIHVSNLMIAEGSGKATRVGRKMDDKTNKSVRYSKKSGEVIK
ncbi:MAG TPA: 50S ribosomal protein L24 [Bacteroidales bacterium]|nr:50S ribosomal protein L24 [Bacteroidales bacterium]HPE56479.1 50S ribosomal protein L24 [Bacteroidales bacterium]HRX95738.1 50S ribosomal protein L24 [Bacteroidales bacterium]